MAARDWKSQRTLYEHLRPALLGRLCQRVDLIMTQFVTNNNSPPIGGYVRNYLPNQFNSYLYAQ